MTLASADFSLEGRTAIVTGANTGIGQGIAAALAAAGARIAAVGRSPMDETAKLIPDSAMLAIRADLSTTADNQRIIDETLAWTGDLDILVNNAGIIRRSDAIDFTEEDWDAVMDTNLKSAFFLAQAAGRIMLPRGRGKIINVASILSFQGGIRIASYTASKGGLAGITRLLSNEWAARGVNVNAIAPGYVVSNNTQALRDDPDRSKAILDRIPAGRWGRPQDIGGAAVYLASPAADYVHGTVLAVDGGWLAR
ncbi:MAG: 2-dehydro-3-deoxy-D-gluconate 5-dehydrogenase KduD [Pseudomonadota bacterium]|nr:2-dehydro-3-deoxy-D-gluconate 5-dehydrogenase KduD [Pseudomonadota bacterium]